jgi:CRISPR-associated protein Csx10
MNALLITFQLLDPLLITRVSNGEENSSRSLPYIPGTAFRGALIARYRSNSSDLLLDNIASDLFFSGKICYLNAYPFYDKNGTRALPLPLSWRKRKGERTDGSEVVDFALDTDTEKDESVRVHFCGQTTNPSNFFALNPVEELSIHISSQERGLVRRENSSVFQYQAIAKKQRFVAAVIANEMQDLKQIKTLLEQDNLLFLGRSRSAKYGRVKIEEIRENEDWREVQETSINSVTIVTLLSDAILKNEYGQPTHDLDGYISRQLNKKIKRQKAFIRPSIVGGFNRKWGLPLPVTSALGMGSVFVYPSNQLNAQDLNFLVDTGIGERIIDGFGRIAVNWPATAKLTINLVNNHPQTINSPLSTTSQKLAYSMSERLLRQRIESNLMAIAQNYKIIGNIPSHQLSRLRNKLRKAINERNFNTQDIELFLDKLKPAAQTQFERVRIIKSDTSNGIRLMNWIKARLKSKDGLAEIDFDETKVPQIAGQKALLTDQLRREFTLRLIESVLDSKMKQNRKEGL